MYTLLGQNFINMIRSFYPNVKVASGGSEVVVRCFKCGDSKDPKHAHLYISVPQNAEDIPLYNCKKCNSSGIVDDVFLRKLGCTDSRVLVDVLKHINDLKKSPKYARMRELDIYPLKNSYISNQAWNPSKLDYINKRIGSNFNYNHLINLKIFLNLYDILNQNRLNGTRHDSILQALNEHFIGFISYDNSFCIMRKIDNVELYKSVNKRYINYNIINKHDSNKDFYVIPTRINIEDMSPVKIHIAEGAFDILSIFYNLNSCNINQNIYISASGKSYTQALEFILSETRIVNYEIHIYPDNDVNDYTLNSLFIRTVNLLPCNIFIHRNIYNGEKDYGVPLCRIKDSVRVIYEKNI